MRRSVIASCPAASADPAPVAFDGSDPGGYADPWVTLAPLSLSLSPPCPEPADGSRSLPSSARTWINYAYSMPHCASSGQDRCAQFGKLRRGEAWLVRLGAGCLSSC